MLDLESLGLTVEDAQERVVETIVERLFTTVYFDEDGESRPRHSQLMDQINESIAKKIKATVDGIVADKVIPNTQELIEGRLIQLTNEFGEKKGESVTLVELMVRRSEEFLLAKVTRDGQDLSSDSYDRKAVQTRLAWMIDKQLKDTIEKAIKEQMLAATSTIAKALHETCRLKLTEIASQLKVGVTCS